MKISRTFETTTEEERMLQCAASSTESLEVNALSNTNTVDTTVKQTSNRIPTNPYYWYGEVHPAAKRRFKQAKYHKFKKGHIAKACQST